MPTYLFTTQELTQLMQRSRAIAGLDANQLGKLQQKVNTAESSAAQQLYQILFEERDAYKVIEKEYLAITNKIMMDFQIEITQIKTEKLRFEQANTEQKAFQAENNAAEALIKSLNL